MSLVRRYASFLVACPYIVVVLTLLFVTGISIATLLPSVGAPEYPDFSKPTKGFEPRGTIISQRQRAFKNFEDVLALGWDKFSFSPNVKVPTYNHTTKENVLRTTRDLPRNITLLSQLISCRRVYENFGNDPDTVVIYGGNNLLTADKLKVICQMDYEYVRSTQGFNQECMDAKYGCCPSMSLGNFIAAIYGRSSCQDITDLDVDGGVNDLIVCAEFFFNGELMKCIQNDQQCDAPIKCKAFASVFSIFYYLTDKNFLNPNDDLQYTAIISPISWWSTNLYEKIYYNYFNNLKRLAREGVTVEAFHFGDFKMDHFNDQLLMDAIYVALALLCVVVFVCFYTCSFFIAFLTIVNIVFASVLGYFFYHIVFGLKFFPFLNITCIVFLVGICADDIFIYCDVWYEAKKIHPRGSLVDWTEHAMRYAAKSMFVTSFTTSSAFFAIVTSQITSLKCFGIFTGTTILSLFFLMITWFPSVLIIHEKLCLKCCCGNSSHNHNQVNTDNSTNCYLQNALRKLRTNIFTHWLPVIVNKLKFLFLVLGFAIVGYFVSVVFYHPGLSIPTSKTLQLFRASHPLEQFDLKLKNEFRFSSTQMQINSVGITGYMVWGVKDVDNGDHFDPDDEGHLEWDKPPDIFSLESQKWLLKLCKEMPKWSFYGEDARSTCFMERFIDMMSGNCTSENFPCCKDSIFPYEENVFDACLRASPFYTVSYMDGPVFDVQSGDIIALVIPLPTNSYSQQYTVNARFWKEVNSWFSDMLSTAPDGLSHGWVTISWLGFYDLQESLSSGTLSSVGLSVALAFGVIFLTTLNIFITLYSIITIISVIAVTVGSLVLTGWQLNILESMTVSIAVGLSVDFTVHYGVAYCLAVDKTSREKRVSYTLEHIGSAVTMAALTTVCTGVSMIPSEILAYYQVGLFLILVMVISWCFATFLFLPLCSFIGPTENFGQLSLSNLCKTSSHHSIHFNIDDDDDHGFHKQYITSFDVKPKENVKPSRKKDKETEV